MHLFLTGRKLLCREHNKMDQSVVSVFILWEMETNPTEAVN